MAQAAIGHALAPILYVGFMCLVLVGGLVLSQLLDPQLWIPRPLGIGWTIDFGNPHAQFVVWGSIVWIVCVFVGLIGLNRPEAPLIGGLMRLFAMLVGMS